MMKRPGSTACCATKMAAEPPTKLDYRSRCLVSQIVEHVKSQGIFDQFRRDCIEELEQKESYRQLKQRVESHVATFLSKQTWTDALPKNQVRDSLRRHINQSEVLERGVKQLISQALESKAKSFQTRIEGVVQNYIYMQHHQQSQDRRNPRYKVIDEKNEAKPSTSEAKQSVACDITQLIPIPVPHSGASSIKTESHVGDKAKYASHDGVKGSVPPKGGQISKRSTPSRTTAAVIKGEGRHVGSPSGSEKDRSSPVVEETSELQDDNCRSAKATMESATCDEGQNASVFEQKVTAKMSHEVKLRVEPESTNAGAVNDKSAGRKHLDSDDNVKVAAKNAEKFESVKKVAGLWTAQSVTTSETVVSSKKDPKKELEESKEPLEPVESTLTMFRTGEGERSTAPVPQHIDSNLNVTDSKLIDYTEEKIEVGAGYNFSSSEKLVTTPYETPIAVTDSDNPTVCKIESTSVKEADAEVLAQDDEGKTEDSTASCEPGLTMSSRSNADDLEHVSEADDHSDGESDVSEVSSVHTSDLSSFDEEVSSLSGSYDEDDEEGGERGENGDEDELAARGKCNTGETDGNDGTSSAQSERNTGGPTRRRSTRICSRTSTKEDDDVFGNDGKVKNRSRDSPRRKRRCRRRRREEPSQVSEGQSESSPVKRRRGRPRKNERRISSSSDNQRRYSRWHSHDDSSSEASRTKRSQRKIKRTRCYSPSSEGTREVFLPCKRSRVGSKD